jgi:TolB-like protein
MIRMVSILALCSLLAACQSFMGADSASVQDFPGLASVRSIYIEDLKDGSHLIQSSDLIKEQISTQLAQSGRFSVTNNAQQADAVLTGVVGIEAWYHGMESYHGMEGNLDSNFLGVGALRLVDAKTKQTIWTHEYEAGILKLHQTVASRVAEQMAGKLLNDTTKADSRKMQK